VEFAARDNDEQATLATFVANPAKKGRTLANILANQEKSKF
jgi:hypothetical protein